MNTFRENFRNKFQIWKMIIYNNTKIIKSRYILIQISIKSCIFCLIQALNLLLNTVPIKAEHLIKWILRNKYIFFLKSLINLLKNLHILFIILKHFIFKKVQIPNNKILNILPRHLILLHKLFNNSTYNRKQFLNLPQMYNPTLNSNQKILVFLLNNTRVIFFTIQALKNSLILRKGTFKATFMINMHTKRTFVIILLFLF